jgi:hypothetical protein
MVFVAAPPSSLFGVLQLWLLQEFDETDSPQQHTYSSTFTHPHETSSERNLLQLGQSLASKMKVVFVCMMLLSFFFF